VADLLPHLRLIEKEPRGILKGSKIKGIGERRPLTPPYRKRREGGREAPSFAAQTRMSIVRPDLFLRGGRK
jgi:hypothetical protein